MSDIIHRSIYFALLLCITPGLANAQTPVGSGFLFESRVEQGGRPVDGLTDFKFRLFYDPNDPASQIGAELVFDGQSGSGAPIDVKDGLLSIILDFGPGVMNGDARWVEIAVRHPHDPTDAGSYATVSPRQELSSAPYALFAIDRADRHSLDAVDDDPTDAVFVDEEGRVGIGTVDPQAALHVSTDNSPARLYLGNPSFPTNDRWGMLSLGSDGSFGLGAVDGAFQFPTVLFRVERRPSSPCVIGGYGLCDNLVNGGTIGGGGSTAKANRISDNYGTIGGGRDNAAGDEAGSNTDAAFATVGGGQDNRAGGGNSTVGGGVENLASATSATVAGGNTNAATQAESFVGGGSNNTASGERATVGGGNLNTASGNESTVPGGRMSVAGGSASFAAGNRAQALHDGTFVWSDSTPQTFSSTAADQFLVRAGGGVGINTESPGAEFDVAGRIEAEATDNGARTISGHALGLNSIGIYGESTSNSAVGPPAAGAGVYGYAAKESLHVSGVVGVKDNNSTGAAGVYGINDGSGGFGVRASSSVSRTIALFAEATGDANDTSGGAGFGSVAGSFVTHHRRGAGVVGKAVAGRSFDAGVIGRTESDVGIGVFGVSEACDGSKFGAGVRGESGGTEGIGVAGFLTGEMHGENSYAVYGEALNGGFAGYFSGNVHVSGTLSKFAGSLKIDHPLYPAEKYLVHSFVESPDMMNIYNGNVTTDAEGRAVVELPAYFEALNGDFRYQLTVIGTFAQAIVEKEIEGGRFAIRTDEPKVKVSWQVTGVRRDPWAKRHRLEVEPEKVAEERGKYLAPELYGEPEAARLRAG